MKLIHRARQAGKTTEIIRAAASESGVYIVCSDHAHARNVARMARDMDALIRFPLTWDEFVGGKYYSSGVSGFMIDDLDRCLQRLTPVPILSASIGGALSHG